MHVVKIEEKRYFHAFLSGLTDGGTTAAAVMLAHLPHCFFLQSARYGRPLLVVKLDLRKAFDTVLRQDAWVPLVHQRYPVALAHALLALHCNRTASLITPTGAVSDGVLLERGFGQGDPTSPFLFCRMLRGILHPMLISWDMDQQPLAPLRLVCSDIVIGGTSCDRETDIEKNRERERGPERLSK